MGGATARDLATIRRVAEAYLTRHYRDAPRFGAELEDLIQVVVIDVSRQLDRGATIANLEAYTTRAARNAIAGEWRRRNRAGGSGILVATLDDHHAETAVDRAARTPSSDVAARDDRTRHTRIIAEAMGDGGPLNATEREVLLLRHEEGLASAEVARIMGMAGPGSVDSTASTARRKLLAHLQRVSGTLYELIASTLEQNWGD